MINETSDTDILDLICADADKAPRFYRIPEDVEGGLSPAPGIVCDTEALARLMIQLRPRLTQHLAEQNKRLMVERHQCVEALKECERVINHLQAEVWLSNRVSRYMTKARVMARKAIDACSR